MLTQIHHKYSTEDVKGRKDAGTRRHTTRGSESRPNNNYIYVAPSIPEWKNGYIVKLPKKGDLGMCRNLRVITLVSVPSKVFTRILLDILKGALDEKLREEQADNYNRTIN